MTANFIKRIWLKESDNAIHSQFVRFSRGTFENRAAISASRNPARIKVSGTFELANDFIILVSELADVKFSGLVSSKIDLDEIFARNRVKADVKKKKGLFAYEVENLSSRTVHEIRDKAYSMLLDAESPEVTLKMKKKLPKPGKSGKNKVDDKFCILEADAKFSKQLHDDFLFDLPLEFKKAKISHTFIISEVILPSGEKDFDLMRLNAKKKGKIIRKTEVDGKLSQQEKDFEA
ncbi:MAG: hypothetical protein V1886_04185 [archaeon]